MLHSDFIVPHTDSAGIDTITGATHRNYLLGRIADGWSDQQAGIAPGTHAQQSGCFARWERLLACCGIQDKFLDTFSVQSRICVMSAFAASVRPNEHGKTGLPSLSGKTVRATLYNVCAQFRTNLRCNPNLEADGRPSLRLKRQIDGYIDNEPAPRHQKCLPPNVFRKLLTNTSTPLSTTIGQLTTGALFYGMRSSVSIAFPKTKNGDKEAYITMH